MNLERYFHLERECQLVTRQMAVADAPAFAKLIEHCNAVIEKARAIFHGFDLPTPEWCGVRYLGYPAVSHGSNRKKKLLMKMKITIDEIDRLTSGRNSRRVLNIPRRRFSGVIFFLIQQPIYFRN
jgi:hypothetical protein